jgi:hypothetical protein
MKKGLIIIGGYLVGSLLVAILILSSSWVHYKVSGETITENASEEYIDKDDLPSSVNYSHNRVYYYRVKELKKVEASYFPKIIVTTVRDTLLNESGELGIYSQIK